MQGAVEFDRPELKLIFDDSLKVVDFSLRIPDLAENLIEECMLIANETVDKHLTNLGVPCLHRVHDRPNLDRLTNYYKLLDVINIPFKKYGPEDCLSNPKALQQLAEHIKENGKLSNMLSLNLVRCMSRAKYSPTNIGHSGLAKENYCHFTSPIRRYPDLTIHRLIEDFCFTDDQNDKLNKIKEWKSLLSEIGEHSSKMEKIADKAEEQTLYMKCCEYMQNHIGEKLEGTIIGISNHGVQVQLDNMVEGKVRLRNLSGDYVYNPSTFTLVSLDNSDNYYIGDRVLVEVVAASKETKIIDFKIIYKIDETCIRNSADSNQLVKRIARSERANKNFKN